jgi:AcrR family transcriptional regulator
MLRAAYRLFCARGYAATTIEAIAAEAGVAVQTVYFTFHTKSTVLAETVGAAVTGFDFWTGAPAEPFDVVAVQHELLDWMADFHAAPDACAALAIYVHNGTEVLARIAPLTAAMHAAAGDRDSARVIEVAERRRVATFRDAVEVLAAKPGGLRPGLSRRRAADILLALFSADLYRALVDRGWSPDECEDYLGRLLAEQLLGTGPADPARSWPCGTSASSLQDQESARSDPVRSGSE